MSTVTPSASAEATTGAQAEKSTKPVHVLKDGLLSVSIFANTAIANGRERTFHNSYLQRRYKDNAGEFQTANSLGKDDLPAAQLLLAKAWNWIVEEEAALRKKAA